MFRGIATDKGELSSARIINIIGAIASTVLLLYHGLWLDSLSGEVLGVYLAYCAGTYAGGKFIDRRYRDVEYSDRHQATRYSSYDGDMRRPGDIEG